MIKYPGYSKMSNQELRMRLSRCSYQLQALKNTSTCCECGDTIIISKKKLYKETWGKTAWDLLTGKLPQNKTNTLSKIPSVLSKVESRRERVNIALGAANGNRERAAKLLGVGTRTLYRWLKIDKTKGI